MTTQWTDARLDKLKRQGDPAADKIAATFYTDLASGAEPAAFFRAGRDSAADPVVARWLATEPDPPEWVDFDRINRGAKFFSDHGLEIGLALFCSALPLGYACSPVANVLDMTRQLESNKRHRVLETAQMVLNVTAPNGLKAGRPGVRTVRQVRLMHAGVRWLVQHDPRIVHAEAEGMEENASWDPRWPMPVSQEHLLGALMAFSVRSLMALDTLRTDYDRDAAEDWMHLWSYVGWLIGIDPKALPIDRATATDLDELLMQRDIRATPAGRRLTHDIHDLLDQIGPMPFFKGLPRAATYVLLGPELAKSLAVRRPGWESWLFKELTFDMRIESLATFRSRLAAAVVRRSTRSIMIEFVKQERHEGRPAFKIPEHLNDKWRLGLKQ